MATRKKTLKLSLAASNVSKNSTRVLDNTLDDFEQSWPTKTKRKKANGNNDETTAVLSDNPSSFSESNVALQPGTSTCFSSNAVLLESTSSVKEPAPQPRRRTTRRVRVSKNDESDVSLALAISASIETANERARMNEEERLVEEGLSEVLTELRTEELEHGSILPALRPLDNHMTQLKKQPKTRKPKKSLNDFILAQRTPRERERLIAEKAAIILTSPEMPQCGETRSIVHAEVTSEYLKRCLVEDSTLWKKTTTKSELKDSTDFYVPELSCRPSPKEKPAQPATLFMHVSQIPGRIQSPKRKGHQEEDLSTQAVLEDLLHRAQGGFVEDATDNNVPTDKDKSDQNLSKLSRDWSHMVDNPLLSDLTVLLDHGHSFRAHRLVLAARCPALLHCVKKDEVRWYLDWTGFDIEAAKSVLRFFYTADSASLSSNSRNVAELATFFDIQEILELPGFSRQLFLDQNDKTGTSSVAESREDLVILPADSSVREHGPDLCNIDVVQPLPIAVDDEVIGHVEVEDPPAIASKEESVIELLDSFTRPHSPDLFDVEDIDRGPSARTPETGVVDLTQDSPMDADYPPVENAMVGEDTAPGPSALELEKVDDEVVDLTQDTPPEAHPLEKPISNEVDVWKDFDEANYDAIYTAPDPLDITPVPIPALVPVPMVPESPTPCGSKDMDNAHGVSFDINDSDLWRVDDNLEAGKSSTPCVPAARKQKSKVTAQVTPLPDYNSMATPQLKQALDRYGLKPLKRKNAVKLLEHIYEELHPLVTDSETSAHNLSTSLLQLESEDSQSSIDSVVEESINVSEDLQPFACSTQEPVSLKKKFQDFLKERADIYERILLYEPLPLEWLLSELKSANIKCKSRQFIDWLDEECIAFRMKNRRNAAGAQRKPARTKKTAATEKQLCTTDD